MSDEEMNEFESAVRMIDFQTANPNLFKDNSRMVSGFNAIQADVSVLEAAGASRQSASGTRSDGTADKRAAKSDLYALVRKTIDTAKTIKKEEPEFDNKFKIRRGTLSGQEVLDAARGFVMDLSAPVIAKFGEYGAASVKPENFDAKIAAFEAARTEQNTGKSSGVAATAQTRAAIARIKKTRRTMCQIGENILEELGDDALRAAWKSACRVERRKPNDKQSSAAANGEGNQLPTP